MLSLIGPSLLISYRLSARLIDKFGMLNTSGLQKGLCEKMLHCEALKTAIKYRN